MIPFGGRQWRVLDLAQGEPSAADAPERGSSRAVTNAVVELSESAVATGAGVVALAVTFSTSDSDQCLTLEIGFVMANAGGTPLDRVSTDCTTSPGRRRQLAVAARGARAGETVVYRVAVHGTADIADADLRAGSLGDGMRWLRIRVAPNTIAALDEAVKQVKSRAVYASRVDWPLATAQALAAVIDGTTTRDALPGVQAILRSLGDRHSWATIIDDEGRLTKDGQVMAYVPPSSRLQRLANGRVVGWLTIPRLGAVSGRETHLYAQAIHAGLSEAVQAGACGFIVDLTGHTGGNMWPGLDGLGPLLGDGAVVGSFKPGSFTWKIDKADIGYRLAAAGLVDPEGLWRAELAQAPVAVIVGPVTASSGEAVAIAFSGRPVTRFFGRKSYGIATSNETIQLGDGLVAFVVVSAMADREGRAFPRGITPQTEDADDAAAAAHALGWLGTAPDCVAGS